uniref:Class I SAM-dependent methyltransferase n=1 Tax=Roseihalotalea indica TaxID=2867963 RepID=A0AA49GN71_9BACT|nr:class I SAM-dependent methyltransferase [Tunicatimonas sp. TK19036]
MPVSTSPRIPKKYSDIQQATQKSGFSMSSDQLTGRLLRTLAATKPGGRFLELGTGTGLSTAWILDGMDRQSSLTSIDNEEKFLSIARQHLGDDPRLEIILSDGEAWIQQNKHLTFDYIFADTWHGKYLLLEETLAMLTPGGLYIIDDMQPQPNWPKGHAEKASNLVRTLEERDDLFITRQAWATGIIIGAKRSA